MKARGLRARQRGAHRRAHRVRCPGGSNTWGGTAPRGRGRCWDQESGPEICGNRSG
jgi:hypothetical protein